MVSYVEGMNFRAVAFAGILLVAACSKVTKSNFDRIHDGMTEQQVVSILGNPTESSSINVLDLSGTSSKWVSNDAVITVQFLNGKVRIKNYERLPAQ
jgi:hypothetical protein